MRILAIADYYDPDSNPPLAVTVASNAIDAVITVGDLYGGALAGMEKLTVPTMGVYGNHCDGEYLENYRMVNLHLRRFEYRGLSFVGLQGGVRYKSGCNDILYTQDQYRALVARLPPADVLVTHCPPRGINDGKDPAHVGVVALLPWIDRHRPAVIIHGHTYPRHPIAQSRGARIEYVHGARILDLPVP